MASTQGRPAAHGAPNAGQHTNARALERCSDVADDEDAIFACLRSIAQAAPTHSFPSNAAFTVPWRALQTFASTNGVRFPQVDATTTAYWAFSIAHHCGDRDLFQRLQDIYDRGVELCARIHGFPLPPYQALDRSTDAVLRNLQVLALAVQVLDKRGDMVVALGPALPWKIEKQGFVLSHMEHAIAAESAYEGAPGLKFGDCELTLRTLRLHARYAAVMERTIAWSRILNGLQHITGDLIVNLEPYSAASGPRHVH